MKKGSSSLWAKCDSKDGTIVEVRTPAGKKKRRSVREFSFAGMWKNRKDIPDGLDYVNRLRENPRA